MWLNWNRLAFLFKVKNKRPILQAEFYLRLALQNSFACGGNKRDIIKRILKLNEETNIK